MRFVPVKLDAVDCIIFKADVGNALEFTPTACAKGLTQPRDFAYPVADGNRLDLFNAADNLLTVNLLHRANKAMALQRAAAQHAQKERPFQTLSGNFHPS